MIFDFEHSFKDYYEILNFYGIWDCSCPVCGASRSMHRHGKYHRNLILWEDGQLLETCGEILRLQCRSCRSTHAVLTMDMIPFFLIPSLHSWPLLVCAYSRMALSPKQPGRQGFLTSCSTVCF